MNTVINIEIDLQLDASEVPNAATAALLSTSQKEIETGDYYHFDSKKKAFDFLARRLDLGSSHG